jgi:hypothetical protein
MMHAWCTADARLPANPAAPESIVVACALLLRGAPMGWEWRCFVPLPTHVSAAVEGPVEERTDEYLLIESEAVGVSARLPLLLLLHTWNGRARSTTPAM